MITANRYHDISCGHRVYGHESKCAHLHGHNYRFWFYVEPIGELDDVGRVMDFSVIKEKLCEWLENEWDHKMLIYEKDPISKMISIIDPTVVLVPFNPTAEQIAMYFVHVIAPQLLAGTECRLVKLTIEETRKCSVTYELPGSYKD